MKLILLGPGDTLIMHPGYLVAHSVLTLDDSIMACGMIWPCTGLDKAMKNMEYIMTVFRTTSELAPQQLTEYIETLLLMAEELQLSVSHAASVNSSKSALEGSFSCECKDDCRDCPCSRVNDSRRHGYTAWCHPDLSDFGDPAKRCTRLPVPQDGKCDRKTGCDSNQCGCSRSDGPCRNECHGVSGKNGCKNQLMDTIESCR